ncbi:MAG: SocA family protein [Bacteroidetes bacterium]|nr:SocA family protein [Bacteroidota bacterium]
MSTVPYIKFSKEQLEKIGNTTVYLSEHIPQLSKTKLLKLLYILDELSIKKSGIPFLNLKYKVWKFGPVSEELFIDLSSETTLLAKYIDKVYENETTVIIKAKKQFDDSEFSDNDIDLMNEVIKTFGNKSAKELIAYTHRPNSPWHNAAIENSVLQMLEKAEINNTEFLIDLSLLVEHDAVKKEIYRDYLENN